MFLRKTKVLIWLFAVTLLACDLHAQQAQLKFSYLTVDNGLSHTDAKDIKQDGRGFIWVATLFGLDRYDGYAIKRFYNSSDSSSNGFNNRIRNICIQNDARFWLGTDNGIACFNPVKAKFMKIKFGPNTPNLDSCNRLQMVRSNIIAGIFRGKLRIFRINDSLLSEIHLLTPAKVRFTDMVSVKNHNLWLSSSKGIWILSSKLQTKQINLAKTELNSIRYTGISSNRDDQLILISNSRCYSINLPQKDLLQDTNALGISNSFNTPNEAIISDVLQDKKDNYWVSTDKGLFYLNRDLSLKNLITNKSYTNSINTNYIDKLFIDRTDCLWLCTYGGGVNFCDLNGKAFLTFKHNPESTNTLSGDHIRAVLEDSTGKVWIGTNESGLNGYDLPTKKFTQYAATNGAIKLRSNEITSLALDKAQNLWVGTNNGIDVLSKARDRILHLPGSEKFPTHIIDALSVDCFGNIWFGGAVDGFGCIYRDDRGFYHVRNLYQGIGLCILADDHLPQLTVSSAKGLNRLIIDKTGTVLEKYQYEVKNDDRLHSLSSNYTYPIRKQNDSTYWIGTIGGGLNRITLKGRNLFSIRWYGKSSGVFNDVEAIELDNKGNIWMGGNGLEKFNPATSDLTRFDKNDGLQGNSFKVGASFKGKDGRLYFGGIDGLNYFYPDSIKLNRIHPSPQLTDIVINRNFTNEAGYNPDNDLNTTVTFAKEITLDHDQNYFAISFSSMHFANALKCSYRYKLDGFDNEWRYTDGKNPTASYTNLDYKKYNFVVEATNSDGIWGKSAASLLIMISPPWWETGIAKAVYFLCFLSGLIGIYVYQGRFYRLKSEIALSDAERKNQEQIHHHKEEFFQQQLQFFTNISHEFRTPLTLIMGPLENLINKNDHSELRQSYNLMYRNAKRLVNLIAELMNFRKVAESVIRLHVENIPISRFINETAEEFRELATNKKINFIVKNAVAEDTSNWLDLHIIEKILFNLLNNSFKYTPEGGEVTLEIFFDLQYFEPLYSTSFSLLSEYRAEKYVFFRIADNGIGISEESISQIFDRFYKISGSHLGSGVGLALVKSLTLLHKGDIFVYSARCKGTEFIIGLPWGEINYSASEKKSNFNEQSENYLEKIEVNTSTPHFIDGAKPGNEFESFTKNTAAMSILIAEDNEELRFYLKNILVQYYNVYEAEDGKAGLSLANSIMPDLIISDVMMPNMNGVEFCKLIKQNFETSHIPFMLLTAKDALESKIEGLESGADHYFSKPFSTQLLLLSINNIFEQRNKLRLRYKKDYYADASELVATEKDKEFIDKLLSIIEANIREPDLDVDFLCKKLFTSRTKLYQKIQGLTGQSVGEFIRTIRLKKAAYIMTHEDVPLNEVVDRIGLISNSYFSRAFKKEFGLSPSHFLQSLKK
ncbi:hybrid sensor histidine kinase/response regulator transcription factor [Mucilaginibacter ginsenosidivorax]|uniref:histidine kinase n=1 Tax=Mucilaginibacter ginsenosidivorax TaxID=862126 RepID=A0A5B8W4V7_9SPHI|nr:hybrid sensor histidine kinase/response regulator transcription factor [Mucilaginibacter ginsenosidivorax]QEC78894.1 response regulator [Mucilaginibacter ginsenosidivorax]